MSNAMTHSPESIEAGMEKIRAMIEDFLHKQNQWYKYGDTWWLFEKRIRVALDCYAALGGDVSEWRDENGILK